MKGIFFDLNIGKAILKKTKIGPRFTMIKYRADWPVPQIRFPNQVQLKTLLCGICASDLHQIDLNISTSASIQANAQNPSPMGHEVLAEVTQLGSEVQTLQVGDRVVYCPVNHCEALGFSPCLSCQKGLWETCLCMTGVGDGSPLEEQYGGSHHFGGFGGGGWCENFVGFASQFYRVPENLPNDIAVLTEPLAVGIHAVARHLPADGDTVLVIGAGIIALSVIAAIRAIGSHCRILVAGKYQFQSDAAMRLGADEVFLERNPSAFYAKVTESTGGQLFKPALGRRILFGNGGPDIIFDCVGSEETISDSLHLVRCNGTVVIVGVGFGVTKHVDWYLTCSKEIAVCGAMMYGKDPYQGELVPTFDLALQFLAQDPSRFAGLVTHRFPIEKFRDAIRVHEKKGQTHAIKIVFDFTSGS